MWVGRFDLRLRNNTPFMRAFALQSSRRKCYPPAMVLWLSVCLLLKEGGVVLQTAGWPAKIFHWCFVRFACDGRDASMVLAEGHSLAGGTGLLKL